MAYRLPNPRGMQSGEVSMAESNSRKAMNRGAMRSKKGFQSKSAPASVQTAETDGVRVFYRAAGDPNAPVILLLHGFPASSFMFRELIPRLAGDYRVI